MTIRARIWLGAMAGALLLLVLAAVLDALVAAPILGATPAHAPLRVLAVGGLALLMFAPLAWLLTWLAYHPVRDVTKTARSILETGELDRRCFYRGPRDDVGQLVVVVNELLVRYDAALAALRRLRSAAPTCGCPRPHPTPDHADLVLDGPGQAYGTGTGAASRRSVNQASRAGTPPGS